MTQLKKRKNSSLDKRKSCFGSASQFSNDNELVFERGRKRGRKSKKCHVLTSYLNYPQIGNYLFQYSTLYVAYIDHDYTNYVCNKQIFYFWGPGFYSPQNNPNYIGIADSTLYETYYVNIEFLTMRSYFVSKLRVLLGHENYFVTLHHHC